MPSSSRIVFAEDIGVALPWRPELLQDARVAAAAQAAEPPQSYEDGLREGMARGLEQGRRDAEREAERVRRSEREAIALRADALIESMTVQLATLQQSMADELTGLAVEIARSALGAALRVRDDAIEPAVVEALAAIVDDHARPVIRLHPDDAGFVGEQLEPLLTARGAQLVPDSGVLPGGCRVETARASVDATVQTRWRRALAALGIDDEWIAE